MRVFLEIEETEQYEPFAQPFVRLDVSGMSYSEVVELARRIVTAFRRPRVYIHVCRHDERRPCERREITSDVLA